MHRCAACEFNGTVLIVELEMPQSTFRNLQSAVCNSQMIVPGSCYWNLGIGREKGEVEQDAEGLRTMQILGENMAWLLKKLAE
jgi:multimeric flavodoxin WrbA